MYASVQLTFQEVLGRVKTSYPDVLKLLSDKLSVRETDCLEGPAKQREPQTRPCGAAYMLWFHARSLGDAAVVLPVVTRCLQEQPNIGILFTSCTQEAFGLLSAALPAQVAVMYAPADTLRAIEAFLSYWQPRAAIFVEEEMWPKMVRQCQQRGIALALLNGSMSPATFMAWHERPAKRAEAESLLNCFNVIIPQSDLDVARFRLLGASLAQMPGWCADLKYAASMGACVWQLWQPPLDRVMALRKGVAGRPVWLAACTHEEEEASIANVHCALAGEWPSLLTVVAPRIPARCIDMAMQLQKLGLRATVWWGGEQTADEVLRSLAATDVLIVDSAADMPLLYAVSEIAFIGWSLEEGGRGHNLAEAAVAGCAVVVGPHAGPYNHMADELNHAAISAAEDAQAAAAAEARQGGCQAPTPLRAAGRHRICTGRPCTAYGHRRRPSQAAANLECSDSPITSSQESPSYRDSDARPSTAPATFAHHWSFDAQDGVDSPTAKSEHLESADRDAPLVSENGSLRLHDRWQTSSPNSPLSPSASIASDAIWPDVDAAPHSPWRPYHHISGAISDEGVYARNACCARDCRGCVDAGSRQVAAELEGGGTGEGSEPGCTPLSCGPVSDATPSRTPWQGTATHRRTRSRLQNASFDATNSSAGWQGQPADADESLEDLSAPLRYAGEYIVPATHLPLPPVGPAVWRVEDEAQLIAAIGSLLREPLERRSRGHAAQIAASRLAASLVGTVWELLDAHVLQGVLSARTSATFS